MLGHFTCAVPPPLQISSNGLLIENDLLNSQVQLWVIRGWMKAAFCGRIYGSKCLSHNNLEVDIKGLEMISMAESQQAIEFAYLEVN